jgi:hypothetical protein
VESKVEGNEALEAMSVCTRLKSLTGLGGEVITLQAKIRDTTVTQTGVKTRKLFIAADKLIR